MFKRVFILATLAAAIAVTVSVAAVANAEGPPPCQADCSMAIVPPIVASPFGVTRGPRGSVWFSLTGAVGRIDQQGQITTYPVPSPNANVGWMTTGPEGSVWFAERGTGKVGRITAAPTAPSGSANSARARSAGSRPTAA